MCAYEVRVIRLTPLYLAGGGGASSTRVPLGWMAGVGGSLGGGMLISRL